MGKSRQYMDYDDYDDEYDDSTKKKSIRDHRRPVKNWKKAWVDHSDDYDEMDEFYSKYNK